MRTECRNCKTERTVPHAWGVHSATLSWSPELEAGGSKPQSPQGLP